ncbi:tyrosine-type recombinase/integrase [Rhizobium cremeum]|uniref:tyrosine-type recombinase/integrase n=1 Tax=Rhizobium cremeum TaxID=2813827 RepID=UPI0039E0AD33
MAGHPMMDVANIDLPYVEKNPSRHGKVRYFLRIGGKRICRLPDDINSEEFSRAYWAARKAAGKPAESVPRPRPISVTVRPESFKWLTMAYMKASAFTMLDATTQAKRRAIIESMWDEPLDRQRPDGPKFADMPMSRLDRGNIEVLRDRKRETPFAADERLKILRQVMDTRGPDGNAYVENTARLVDSFRVHSDGHHTITSDEIAQYIAHHGPQSKAVLAVALMMFTGFRVSDLAVIGPQHRRNDMFRLRLFKNRNRTPVDIEIALHPILEAVLDSHKVKGLTYLQTEYGKPFSVKGLGNRISAWFEQANLPHCTAHSVRKGLATDQAHNEATDSMLEAMFGWRDGKTSKIYTRNAERARLARLAVAKINWDGIGTKLLTSEG